MKKRYIDTAKQRVDDDKWLNYSSHISRRILAAIDDIPKMSQQKLAEILEVEYKYINRAVKGQENFSLKTIAKISEALGVELISFPAYSEGPSTEQTDIAYTTIQNTLYVVDSKFQNFFKDLESVSVSHTSGHIVVNS